MEKIIGQTKDVGFQFGIRKTFPLPLASTWAFMFSKRGLSLWLGELENELEINQKFKTKEGIEGIVRVFKPLSHIRLNWKKKDWHNISTLQVRIFGDQQKTTISFHQEKLHHLEQRDEMQTYWNNRMKAIRGALEINTKIQFDHVRKKDLGSKEND